MSESPQYGGVLAEVKKDPQEFLAYLSGLLDGGHVEVQNIYQIDTETNVVWIVSTKREGAESEDHHKER